MEGLDWGLGGGRTVIVDGNGNEKDNNMTTLPLMTEEEMNKQICFVNCHYFNILNSTPPHKRLTNYTYYIYTY